MNNKIVAGQYYLTFIPPGWLLVGYVQEVTDIYVVFRDAAYLELSGDGHSPFAELARSRDPRELKKISSKFWPMAEGTLIRVDAILIATPCAVDQSVLTRAHVSSTIKGAK